MANLKDISTVPEIDALEGTEKVLLNVDGSARQARVDLIKPKTTRELVCEWNFSLDDEVYELIQNFDEDISWLVSPAEDAHYEIEASEYGGYWNDDADVIDSAKNVKFTFSYLASNKCSAEGFGMNNGPVVWDEYFANVYDYETGYNYYACICLDARAGVHYDEEEDDFIPADEGGCIRIYADECGPLKSVKIYKITK